MDGDRFYYLYRLFGTQMGEEVNNGQFKDIVERNTGLTHLNGSVFSYADEYLRLRGHCPNRVIRTPTSPSTNMARNCQPIQAWASGSDGGLNESGNGALITINGVQYIRDVRGRQSGCAERR